MELDKALAYVLKDIPEEVKQVFRDYVDKWDYEGMDEWCIVDTPYGVVDVNLVGSDYNSNVQGYEICLAVYPTRLELDGTIHTDWTTWESKVIPLSLFD